MAWLTASEVDRIKAQLKVDEGFDDKVYLDSVGLRTFGIGHLIKKGDPEYKLEVGTSIGQDRIDSAFVQDFNEAAALTKEIYPECETWPSEVKEIMVNMAFNLGGRLKGFKNLAKALEERNWTTAADEMKNSKWYGQVKSRGERLVGRMRAVKDK
ncbi:probable T4-type lysozyme 1 [Ruditapes philippinarum]|uniref:probable T4-type lysozyme 1 n=1 Tax=Ruditapes philippinarum TaxID=129788 RepID=UPI00295B591A|nr:probable T4-type lysozyme 1 [Ruditapes philippinarum]